MTTPAPIHVPETALRAACVAVEDDYNGFDAEDQALVQAALAAAGRHIVAAELRRLATQASNQVTDILGGLEVCWPGTPADRRNEELRVEVDRWIHLARHLSERAVELTETSPAPAAPMA